jgi:predicted Rossmann fold flavoprotein
MTAEPRQFDVIVLGAGAAGLMCAAVAGGRGRRVAVLEHNGQPGRKILISGGGRCNFTNLHCRPENFLSENPHFAKSALALYQPRHFLELVERHGIAWHEKTLGQLFCDGSARAIVEMLLAECARVGVEIVLNATCATCGGAGGPSGRFRVETSAGEFQAESLVVATGGLSIPKLGATGLGYELARQFGLKIVEPRPALVPLVLGGDEAGWTELAGVSAEVAASAGKARFREKMLVTHRGLSGPAVLQASLYRRPGAALVFDFVPGIERSHPSRKITRSRFFDSPSLLSGSLRMTATRVGHPLANSIPEKSIAIGAGLFEGLKQPGARRDLDALRKALREALPRRLADYLAEIGAPKGWTNAALEECERRLHRWEFHPTGTEGFEKAEVTAGGVDTADLQARTMEARAVPGLFFIGEVVDVTGQLGGFNFQWAWASGVAAGRVG